LAVITRVDCFGHVTASAGFWLERRNATALIAGRERSRLARFAPRKPRHLHHPRAMRSDSANMICARSHSGSACAQWRRHSGCYQPAQQNIVGGQLTLVAITNELGPSARIGDRFVPGRSHGFEWLVAVRLGNLRRNHLLPWHSPKPNKTTPPLTSSVWFGVSEAPPACPAAAGFSRAQPETDHQARPAR